MPLTWSGAKEVTGVLVDLTLMLGAVAAFAKFRFFNMLGHRWQSTLECAHFELPDGSIVFTADYTISNTGQRPLQVRSVSIRVVPTMLDGRLLVPDEAHLLAERHHDLSEADGKGNLQLEPGERSIFTLRAVLPHLPDTLFVLCAHQANSSRLGTTFRGFYSRWAPARQTIRSGGTQSPLPPAPDENLLGP